MATALLKLQSGIDGRIWVEYVENVAIIRMDCGENRFNHHFLDGLNSCLEEILKHPDIQAVITVGVGKFYSNGLDLNWLSKISTKEVQEFIKKWHNTLRRFLLFPLPTIAALNGHTIAGGAMLSLCHDYRIMQEDRGWWSVNEVHLGLPIPTWLIKLIIFKLSGSKAQTDVLLFGKRLNAREAFDLGVVQQTTSPNNVLSAAQKMASEIYHPPLQLNRDNLSMMKEHTFAEILQHFNNELHVKPDRFASKI